MLAVFLLMFLLMFLLVVFLLKVDAIAGISTRDFFNRASFSFLIHPAPLRTCSFGIVHVALDTD